MSVVPTGAQSRIEQLLSDLLNGNTSDISPQSRNEAFLLGLINGVIPDILPVSRVECYLKALCEKNAGSTYILVDSDGNEVVATLVDEATVFDATANDIRLGKVAATESGVTTGTKEIPAYHTTEGVEKIPAGSALTIPMFSDKCQYTKLQALICTFNTLVSDSVATEKVSIDGKVYNVGSTTVLSEVSVDSVNQSINLSLMNDSDHPVVIRYFTYKEEM